MTAGWKLKIAGYTTPRCVYTVYIINIADQLFNTKMFIRVVCPIFFYMSIN